MLSADAQLVLRDLNPWWAPGGTVRPKPPAYQRPALRATAGRLKHDRALIEVLRGPRQVGKTTGLHQIVQQLLDSSVSPRDILFVRFDLELLRDEPAALRNIVEWFAKQVRQRPLTAGAPAFVFLDEIHKLPKWSNEVKHVYDTFGARVLLTGSSSVLVARGGRESLAGRIFTTEVPPFSFREVLECWSEELAAKLPPPIPFDAAFDGAMVEFAAAYEALKPQKKLAIRRKLERYYTRGGYPRLHSGEVDDDRWADYVVQTVFENVLGADIPDLFPVEHPRLLRALYLEIARQTGKELSQNGVTQTLNAAGFATNQPTVGKYMHYLADALLIREFRRYPLAKKATARVPAKVTLTDLGVRNAILRGAHSLWESDPTVLGPLVETLVQSALHGSNMQFHFFRDYEVASDRRSAMREVDFVAERIDGSTLPIEVKFRRRIDGADYSGLATFSSRYGNHASLMVTRETMQFHAPFKCQLIPLEAFLLAFR